MSKVKQLILNKNNKILIVTPECDLSTDFLLDYIGNQISHENVKIIQLNGANLNDKLLYDFTIKLRQLTSFLNSLLIIHNRIDILKIANTDGIFFDLNSIEPKLLLKHIDEDKFLGTYFDSGIKFNSFMPDYIISSGHNIKDSINNFVLKNTEITETVKFEIYQKETKE